MTFMKSIRVLGYVLLATYAGGCGSEADPVESEDTELHEKAQSLEILDPSIDLSTYTLYTVEQRQNHPEAGEPEYAFIYGGTEAVKAHGPTVAARGGLFRLDGARIQKHPEATYEDSPYTWRVRVNSRLFFHVKVSDYDGEVELAGVRLTRHGSSIRSVFILSGSSEEEGVAHDMVITPFTHGRAGTPTSPVSIESRFAPGPTLEILDPGIDLSTYTVYELWERQDHPEAGEPWYAYIQGGTEAVKVYGPSFRPQDGGLFLLEGARIEKHPEATYEDSPYTWRVTVNSRLFFDVKASDYDGEVELAAVKLNMWGPYLDNVFIFSGSPEEQGVAHDLIITPFVDGVAGEPTSPVFIESRL